MYDMFSFPLQLYYKIAIRSFSIILCRIYCLSDVMQDNG